MMRDPAISTRQHTRFRMNYTTFRMNYTTFRIDPRPAILHPRRQEAVSLTNLILFLDQTRAQSRSDMRSTPPR